MLIYSDRIMVDFMLAWQKRRILYLKQEIVKIKNRPEPTEEPPPKNVIHIAGCRARLSLVDPIDKWTAAHFIKYFQKKYKEKYGKGRNFSVSSWKYEAFRIHYFLERYRDEIDKSGYKTFIDWIFKKIATRKFVPFIGNIVSDNLYHKWRDSQKRNVFENYNGFTHDINDVNKIGSKEVELSGDELNKRIKDLGK